MFPLSSRGRRAWVSAHTPSSQVTPLEHNQEFLARMRVNSSTTSFIGSSKKSNRA